MALPPPEPTPPSRSSPKARLGKLGKYELLEVIGDGSEGRVYKARCIAAGVPGVKLGEIVALKRLRFTGDEDDSRRFESQTKILGALNHPNIVDYKDSFVSHESELDQEVYCLVTELLEGETLKSLIDRHPSGLPWERTKGILLQVLEALRYASQQVVHRDLKLSNIFVVENDVVKLIDFGIARRQDSGASVSAAGFRGTWDYMAPDFVLEENFRGDECSDVFSFGVCAYHLLTGKLPFPALGDNPQIAYMQRWLDSSKSPQVEYRHPVFSVFSRVRRCLDACLAIKRDLRCKSFDEVTADFSDIKPRRVPPDKETYSYEYTDYLGKGGFGRVFRARRVSDGADVAIKEMIAGRDESRFVDEAKILQKARHPHLVEYLDFVQVEAPDMADQRKLFLVLEYLKGMPGASLRERIKTSENGLEPIEALRLFAGYLDCLQHLHGQGIIHRDIKPGNLYAPTGAGAQGKIFDLGIAHDTEGTRTHGQVPGTFDYMPPEFATQNSSRGSPQSDIYSLGVTLYEALTKRLPFASVAKKNEAEAWVAFYQRSEKPVECSFEHNSFVEFSALKPLIRRALAHYPRQRYRTAAEMQEDINWVVEQWEERRKSAAAKAAPPVVEPDTVTASRDQTAATIPFSEPPREPPPIDLPPLRPSAENAPPQPVLQNETDVRQAALKTATSQLPLANGGDNIQFTVFRPQAVEPLKWYPLLAFAHLSERRPNAPENEPDPLQEVQNQARQALGEQLQDYHPVTQDGTEAVPKEGELTFVPEVPGIEFNPSRATFLWLESVHRQDFRLRAMPELDGQTARGRLTVFLGMRIVADVPLAIRVDAQVQRSPASTQTEAVSARPYRKVFASYSHKDAAVVDEFERMVVAFGDQYLRDSLTLRAGEVWNSRLAEMIREADIFQLFWSGNSMRSDFVRQEWEHALSLNRQHFIRPVYWEEPLPEDRAHRLPPEALSRLHFQRLMRRACSTDPTEARANADSGVAETERSQEFVDRSPAPKPPAEQAPPQRTREDEADAQRKREIEAKLTRKAEQQKREEERLRAAKQKERDEKAKQDRAAAEQKERDEAAARAKAAEQRKRADDLARAAAHAQRAAAMRRMASRLAKVAAVLVLIAGALGAGYHVWNLRAVKLAAYGVAVKAGESLYDNGDFLGAIAEAEKALALSKSGVEAQSLEAKAQRQKEKVANYKDAVKNASDAFQGQNYAKSVEWLQRAAEQYPDHPVAQSACRDEHQQYGELIKQRNQRLQVALQRARDAVAKGDDTSAFKEADEVLKLEPRHAEGEQIKQQAQKRLAQKAENDRQYLAALKQAREFAQAGKHGDAVAKANEALGLRPGDSEATKVRDDAQKQLGFAEAIKRARDAINGNRYEVALTNASRALQLQPGHTEAADIQRRAQNRLAEIAEAERSYQVALQRARDAEQKRNPSEALAQAGEALRHKAGDPEALRIRDRAQNRLDLERALRLARDAMAQSNYVVAVTNASRALALEQGQAEAADIKQRAETQLKLQEAAERNYLSALTGAKEALRNESFPAALAHAKEALKAKPGAPEAMQCQQRAQEGLDLQAARKAFDDGDYDGVARMCESNSSVTAFTRLGQSNNVERTALNLTEEQFGKGEYAFIADVSGKPWAGKKRFQNLTSKGQIEKARLDELNQWQRQTNWTAVIRGLQALTAEVTNKPPFRDVAQWAAANNPIKKLDAWLRVYEVWLGTANPSSDVIDPSTGKPHEKLPTGSQVAQLSNPINALEQNYNGLSALTPDRQRRLAALRKKIILW